MEIFPFLLLFGLLVFIVLSMAELYSPTLVLEGFSEILPRTTYWSSYIAPRSDIDSEKEDPSYIRDPRYFNDYADVGRLGVPYDFCRMLAPAGGDEKSLFFACALAGTDKLDSVKFRTASVKDGFRVSYDDYMRDVNGDGRMDYCRILKWKDGTYQPVCQKATDIGFDSRETIDGEPPESIQSLLHFYDGCALWLRFFNDLKDSVDSGRVQIAGGLSLDERPRRKETEGLAFNGIDQFIRLSDSSDLSLGMKVPLRSIRAWMVWVKFDEFTNNAKIFDFGNGAGKGNVFLGILGKGDQEVSQAPSELLCGEQGSSTLPSGPSGAQPVSELSPKLLMETSDANVNEYKCVGFETHPRRLPPSVVGPPVKKKSGKATLLYEVWDQQQRKMRIKINNAIPLGTWTHICVTATDMNAFRPAFAVFVNGKKLYAKEDGFLPSTGTMTNCYIGKSNWANNVSQYENRDELFKGRLFDFRAYKRVASEQLIQETLDWGKEKLGIPQ